MSFDFGNISEDPNIDRRIPKSMRKTYDKRRGPIAARSSTNGPKPGTGIHHRHRRRYGL